MPLENNLLQKNLLEWYRANARDLPWRKTKDPYKIWVSEIMLQQTQVNTVIPYYNRWIKTFPTVQSLAKAPTEKVMKHWAGLGYYRRARMLHNASKHVVKNLQGVIPSEVLLLRKLPGIGPYTAGAISSIAFDTKSPILDGNVIRILTRIFAQKDDISSPQTIKKLWKLSESVLPESSTGDFNQAMMELGATVCFPENPLCQNCPVNRVCQAHLKKKETHFPVNKQKIKLEKIKTATLILRQNGKVLVQKQPRDGRWGNLWMFPHWTNKKAMTQNVRFSVKDLKKIATIEHGFTKYQIELEVFESLLSMQTLLKANSKRDLFSSDCLNHSKVSKWVAITKLKNLPFPAPHQKIVQTLNKRANHVS